MRKPRDPMSQGAIYQKLLKLTQEHLKEPPTTRKNSRLSRAHRLEDGLDSLLPSPRHMEDVEDVLKHVGALPLMLTDREKRILLDALLYAGTGQNWGAHVTLEEYAALVQKLRGA